MNTQTRNYITSAELYAKEFVANLDPIAALTDADIERIAKEQADLSIEQAEYQDGVNVEDLREYGLEDVFSDAIRAARDEAAKKMKPRQIKLTPAQNAVLENILVITGEKYAALTRRLLKMEAEMHGLDFPDDTPSNDISKAQAARWQTIELTDDTVRAEAERRFSNRIAKGQAITHITPFGFYAGQRTDMPSAIVYFRGGHTESIGKFVFPTKR